MACVTRHSSAAGLSATRGGLTMRLGASAMPAAANSDTPSGSEPELAFIAAKSGRVARLKTNSPVSIAFLAECFRVSEVKASKAGRVWTRLKKL